MWLFYSILSAILTGIVPIFGTIPSRSLGAAKTAVARAAIVLLGAGLLFILSGVRISIKNPVIWLIFPLAGLCDALAWLLFFRAIAGTSTETAVIAEKICVPMSILLTCVLAPRMPSFAECAAVLFFLAGILYATRGTQTFLPFLSALCTALQLQLSKVGIGKIGSESAALFFRSIFSLTFLVVLTLICGSRLKSDANKAESPAKAILYLVLTGICAFFAWMFCFLALNLAPPAKVQAITKLSFWISGIYLSFRRNEINRQHWFAFVSMTAGALVLIS